MLCKDNGSDAGQHPKILQNLGDTDRRIPPNGEASVPITPDIAAEVPAPMQHTLERVSSFAVRSFRFNRVHPTAHRFSRRLFGADPREVSQYLVEADQAMQNLVEALEHERHELETHLHDATRQIEALRAELDAAEQCAAAYRMQEALFGRALIVAQRTAEDLQHAAQVEAVEMVSKAETLANEIIQTGCRNASDILQKAQQDSDAIVCTANEQARMLLTALRMEAGRLVVDISETFDRARRSVEQDVASLASRLEIDLADGARRLADSAAEDGAAASEPGQPRAEEKCPAGMPASVDDNVSTEAARIPSEAPYVLKGTQDIAARARHEIRDLALQGATFWTMTAAILGAAQCIRRFVELLHL